MSRKIQSTVCKSKQIPRIFQRRKPNVCGTGRTSWNLVIDGVALTSNANENNRRNPSPTNYLETKENDQRLSYDEKKNDCTTKNCNNQGVNAVGSVLASVDGENIDRITNVAETVADIEKWLKTRSESVSSIDLDSLKNDSTAEVGSEAVGVEHYLANDLPHGFLDKDSDGLSLDIDLSDKKLHLGYDPILQELRSDKLLEAVCDKNESFMLPDFQLDHLHPLTLSPEDMMVAGEILPSTSNQPSADDTGVGVSSSSNGINGDNDDSANARSTEAEGELIETDIYELAEELEVMGGQTNFDDTNDACLVGEIDTDELVGLSQITSKPQMENQATKNKTEPRIKKKRATPVDKKSDNQITLRGEECNLEGRDGIMAVVAISTDNVSNMTQIVINAGEDEQIYQGKTSALIRATGNFPKLPRIDASMSWNNCSDNGADNSPNTQHELIISRALAELGITDECLQPMTNNEHGRTWLCPRDDCSREFNKIYALKGHLLAHYGVRPFKCDHEGCAWAFHSDFKLKRHKETHLKRKDFVCAIPNCNRRFTTVYNLWSHEKLHTRPNRVICQVPNCQEKFQTKRALELHMKTHDQSHAPYVCQHDGCGKRYYSSNALTSHQRCHSYKEIDVKCSWPGCGKLFDKPCRLKAHLRSHTGCKPYTCTFNDCQWAFSSSSKLKRHEKKHTNERKFVCNNEGCGKAFMRSEHLKEHSLTHKEGMYFECYICDSRFSAKSSLYVHIKKHQSNEIAESSKLNNGKLSKRKTNEHRGTDEICVNKMIVNNDYSSYDEFYDNSQIHDACDNSGNLEACDLSYKSRRNVDGNIIDNSDKSSTSVCDGSMISIMNYNFYKDSRTMTKISEPQLETGDAIIVDESPVTIDCLPEPEPPPLDTTSSYLSLNSYRTENFASFDKRSTRSNRGAARTEFTREEVCKLKTKNLTTETSIAGATDVVLGTTDLTEGLLLTEELPSMYYQDDIVGTECQMLLLDSSTSENTITLRGLE